VTDIPAVFSRFCFVSIAFATNFPGNTPEKVKELKYNMAGFKEAIAKVNQGTMDYATMRSLYG
jgi:hypothetical protein